MADPAEEQIQKIKTGLPSMLDRGLHKHCDGAGCTYNATGVCRFGKGKSCPVARAARKMELLERNKSARDLVNRQAMRDIVLEEGVE